MAEMLGELAQDPAKGLPGFQRFGGVGPPAPGKVTPAGRAVPDLPLPLRTPMRVSLAGKAGARA